MTLKDRTILCLFLFGIIIYTYAQNKSTNNIDQLLQIDKEVPAIYFEKIDYFNKNRANISEFKGKWLVLDFWSVGCVGCVKSFPKINALQQIFKKEVQFILIGKREPNVPNDIINVYEKFKEKYDLNLAIAYDSISFKKFNIRTVPHIVIIDPNGVVRAITTSINEYQLNQLIEYNDASKFSVKTNEYLIDLSKPIFSEGNDNIDYKDILYTSILSNWDSQGKRYIVPYIDFQLDKGMFQGVGYDVRQLYMLAYLGTGTKWDFNNPADDPFYNNLYPDIVLKVSDSLLFKSDFSNGFGVYNYSLKIPKNNLSKLKLQEIMRLDLKKYFGFDAQIEIRDMPFLELHCLENCMEKLKTSGGEPKITGNHGGKQLTNFTIDQLIRVIKSYIKELPPVIDRTNITYNIDINLNVILTDFNELKNALKNNGLYFTAVKKKVRVLVIKDQKVELEEP